MKTEAEVDGINWAIGWANVKIEKALRSMPVTCYLSIHHVGIGVSWFDSLGALAVSLLFVHVMIGAGERGRYSG